MAPRWWLLILCLAGSVLHTRAQYDSRDCISMCAGFISIDCGLQGEESYVDDETKLLYISDAGFTDAGVNYNISVEYLQARLPKSVHSLRSFPDGVRNCYTLRSLVSGLKYVFRATFLYGNYDGLNQRPASFDLYIGVNFWTVVNMSWWGSDQGDTATVEAIVVVPHNLVQVCLVNTGGGTPFISRLELRPLKMSLYPQVTTAGGLVLLDRINFAAMNQATIRYPDDPYDRLWYPWSRATVWAEMSTIERVDSSDDDPFEAPTAVLQTAVTPLNASENIKFYWDAEPQPKNPTPGYIAIFHFAELQLLDRNAWPHASSTSISAVSAGTGRPNLSSSGLNGDISSSFANFKALQYLNLSNNNLTGSIPDALSQLQSLTDIDLSGNHLNGLIPSGLLKRIQDGSLNLRHGNNPNLCAGDNSCQLAPKRKSKLVIYVIVPLLVIVFIVSVVVLVLFMLRRRKQQQGSMNNMTTIKPQNKEEMSTRHGGASDSLRLVQNRRFTYKELEMITNGFERVLAQGGFGRVYDGFLEDGTQVAVKLRSHSSKQGVNEFLTEAQILNRIHHKNLVTMIGYCKDGEYMALVYEYMSQGTLQEHIAGSDRSLPWRQRLRIALEYAQGLEYLHKGCNPPLIHRDVKATNILLNARLEAKIADFGLSKAFNNHDGNYVSTNTIVGTPGYVDPEYQATVQPTTKSDVYSFGVVLLELVTGKPALLSEMEPMNIIHWVRQRLARGNMEDVVDGFP
ncbi:hypothetical protein VPH35_012510 [Triticum aestivum]